MKRIMAFLAMTAGGWIGWALGALVSTFMAFILSVVGTGVALFYANRLGDRYLP